MSKYRTYIIWVIIVAVVLIVSVYVYYEKKMDVIEEHNVHDPPIGSNVSPDKPSRNDTFLEKMKHQIFAS